LDIPLPFTLGLIGVQFCFFALSANEFGLTPTIETLPYFDAKSVESLLDIDFLCAFEKLAVPKIVVFPIALFSNDEKAKI